MSFAAVELCFWQKHYLYLFIFFFFAWNGANFCVALLPTLRKWHYNNSIIIILHKGNIGIPQNVCQNVAIGSTREDKQKTSS